MKRVLMLKLVHLQKSNQLQFAFKVHSIFSLRANMVLLTTSFWFITVYLVVMQSGSRKHYLLHPDISKARSVSNTGSLRSFSSLKNQYSLPENLSEEFTTGLS